MSNKVNRQFARTHQMAGVTLVELLVVIGIIVAVMAVAVPVVRLATDGNKISSSADQVVSFISSVKAEAQANGKSYLIFERNHNAPNLCYRMYRGKPRPEYRGEDQTSYVVPAGIEYVNVSNSVDNASPTSSNPLTIGCHVFYIYNCDAGKIQPFQYLSIEGRQEKYEVLKARTIAQPTPPRAANTGMYRPVVKVFTLANVSPLLKLSSMEALNGTPVTSSNTYSKRNFLDPWSDWDAAFVTDPAVEFWPESPLWTNTAQNPNYDPSNDIPRDPASGVIRLYQFSVTQAPYVDELDFVTLPAGTAIHLDGSGFDTDGSAAVRSPTATTPSFSAVSQFAWPDNTVSNRFTNNVDPLSSYEDDATAIAILNAEMAPAGLGIDSTVRTQYFPMVEFNSRGQMDRAFACSPFLTAMLSQGTDVVRATPFQPTTPMFLLIGKSVDDRSSPSRLASEDYWISVNQATGRITKYKVEDNPPDVDGIGGPVGNIRDSRLLSVGGIAE